MLPRWTAVDELNLRRRVLAVEERRGQPTAPPTYLAGGWCIAHDRPWGHRDVDPPLVNGGCVRRS